MNNNCKKVKLSEVCKIQNGFTFKSSLFKEKGLPIIRISNIQENKIDINNIVYFNIKDYSVDFTQFEIKRNDIIIAMSGATTGKIGINDTNTTFYLNQRVGKFIPNKKLLYNKFLFYYILTKNVKILSIASSSAQPNISPTKLLNIQIPLPPMEEQKKIVDVLDKLNNIIKKRKKQLEKLDELIKSKFIEMFGDPVTNPKKWEVKTLSCLTEITSSKRIFEKEYVESGIPFYRTKEIVELDKNNNISTKLFISESKYNEIKSLYSVPQKNDILISAVGTIGICWIVPNNNPFYFKDGNLLWIKQSKKFVSLYIKFVLSSLIIHSINNISSGSAYNALTIIKLKELSIPIPPLDLQNKFAEFVETVEKQKSLINKSLEKLELTLKSLMQEYFE